MASYPCPITHNNVLNTVFNSGDFNFSSLSNTNVSGNLNVSGIGTFSSGIQNNGDNFIVGNSTVSGNSTIINNETVGGTLGISNLTTCTGGLTIGTSSNLTLPSGKIISSSNDVVDITNTQSIAGLKTISSLLTCNGGLTIGTTSSLTLPSTQVITNAITLVDIGSSQTISGQKTFSGFQIFSSGLQLPTPAVIIASLAVPAVSCGNKSYASFTLTMSMNITGFGFSSIRAGGQYVIFVTGGSSIYTISNALSGGNPASFKTNFGGSALSIPINGSVILNCFYDGTTMYVSYVSYA